MPNGLIIILIMPDGTPFFEIEEYYVKPECRSRGIGRKLIEYVKKAVSSDAKYILLSTATKNWKAIFHFYPDEIGMEFRSATVLYGGTLFMISLKPVHKEDRDLLWNINQKYLYEMTNYYDDPMDDTGNYHYGHFEEYFTDAERKAFFIYNDETMIGFAMICPYSSIGHHPDYTMAEFTIFPAFRRRHYAMETAEKILSLFPGNWEIKYNEKNTGAKRLWTLLTAPYHPVIHNLNEEETVFEFSTARNTV